MTYGCNKITINGMFHFASDLCSLRTERYPRKGYTRRTGHVPLKRDKYSTYKIKSEKVFTYKIGLLRLPVLWLIWLSVYRFYSFLILLRACHPRLTTFPRSPFIYNGAYVKAVHGKHSNIQITAPVLVGHLSTECMICPALSKTV
jgi:hypothetical protein